MERALRKMVYQKQVVEMPTRVSSEVQKKLAYGYLVEKKTYVGLSVEYGISRNTIKKIVNAAGIKTRNNPKEVRIRMNQLHTEISEKFLMNPDITMKELGRIYNFNACTVKKVLIESGAYEKRIPLELRTQRPSTTTDEPLQERVIASYKREKSVKTVSVILGLNIRTIYRILERNNIQTDEKLHVSESQHNLISNKDYILKTYKEGKNIENLAKEFSVSWSRMKKFIIASGAKITPKAEYFYGDKQICRSCKELKALPCFSKDQKQKHHLSRNCKNCYSASQKLRQKYIRIKNPISHNKDLVRSRKRRLSKIQKVDAILMPYKMEACKNCKKTFHPVAMDFDHVRGEKLFNISLLEAAAKDLELLQEEVQKCDMLCANCHAVKTRTDVLANSLFSRCSEIWKHIQQEQGIEADFWESVETKKILYKSGNFTRREKQNIASMIRRKIHQIKLDSFKGNTCKDCKLVQNLICLEFDHLYNKEFNIGGHTSISVDPEILKLEIEKCDIVCKACHRVRTYIRSGSLRYQEWEQTNNWPRVEYESKIRNFILIN